LDTLREVFLDIHRETCGLDAPIIDMPEGNCDDEFEIDQYLPGFTAISRKLRDAFREQYVVRDAGYWVAGRALVVVKLRLSILNHTNACKYNIRSQMICVARMHQPHID
jgi:hypothetical protein